MINTLRKYALNYRNAIELAKDNKECFKVPFMNNFPRDCCDCVSDMLAFYLKEKILILKR